MNNKPTEKELEILQVLWRMGSATVREINDKLSEKKEVGYTTTLKLMQIMFDKGILERRAMGKTHEYTPLISEEDTQKTLVEQLMQSAFQGSAMKLVMQALGNKKSSSKELEEIKKFIDQLDK